MKAALPPELPKCVLCLLSPVSHAVATRADRARGRQQLHHFHVPQGPPRTACQGSAHEVRWCGRCAVAGRRHRHQPPVESDLQQRLRNAPRMARLKEEFVPGLVPDLWVRLLAAPLAEQMAPMVLRR